MEGLKTIQLTPSDGTTRTLTYKRFRDEIRVYKIYGDITDDDAIAEMAQELCLTTSGVTRVTFKI